jgi:FKBP-type peptidyl-prolyl cis-trans isomerase FklB
MRIGLGVILAIGLGVAVQLPARAADDKPAFKDEKEKASYGIGMSFAGMLKRGNMMDVDVDVIVAAFRESLAGKETRMTDQQAQEAVRAYQMESRRKLAEKNKAEGTAFLATNKSKPGVNTLTVSLSDTNQVQMQYKVITEGTGPIPGSNDMVSVKYRGTFINGKEFDNSEKMGQPFKTKVGMGIIRGWTAALEKMKVGSKWELFIPSALAYGDMGRPNIEGGSTLIFEVELLGIEPPAPPPPQNTAQPLTSDIIKVPSAEELKKGAKIEVIKPEEAARQAAEAQKKNAEEKK